MELCQIEASMRASTFFQWGRMSQSGLRPKFTKQTSSDSDETWSKNQAHDGDAVVRIWEQSAFSLIFPVFCRFGSLRPVLVGKTSPEGAEKPMDGYLTFLAFFRYVLSAFRAPGLGEKGLCQPGKSMSTCATLEMAQNAP